MRTTQEREVRFESRSTCREEFDVVQVGILETHNSSSIHELLFCLRSIVLD